jgi:GNAT superfamily N-acetyltransferase/effector-binding domain-containing protein
MLIITRATSKHQDFQQLVKLLDAYLATQYGALQTEYDRHNVVEEIDTVIMAYAEGRPVGCGALRPYDKERVEVKRMYVRPAYRGQGIGGRMLDELEAWAAELGYARAVLETGLKQFEAIALYRKHGYRQSQNYGPYVDQPNSVCFEKALPIAEPGADAPEILIQSVLPIRAIAFRTTSGRAFEPLFNAAKARVIAFADEHGLNASGPLMAVYYEDPTDPNCDCDFAVALPTDDPIRAGEGMQILSLPGVATMATCVVPGSISADEADRIFAQILAWIEARGYRIDGPYREIYVSEEAQTASAIHIEIQFPIKKRPE